MRLYLSRGNEELLIGRVPPRGGGDTPELFHALSEVMEQGVERVMERGVERYGVSLTPCI